jgi:hypothetical protein
MIPKMAPNKPAASPNNPPARPIQIGKVNIASNTTSNVEFERVIFNWLGLSPFKKLSNSKKLRLRSQMEVCYLVFVQI